MSLAAPARRFARRHRAGATGAGAVAALPPIPTRAIHASDPATDPAHAG